MDVIGTGRELGDVKVPVRRRPATGWGVWLAAGLVLMVALIGFSVGRLRTTGGLFGAGSVGDLTGSMVLELGANDCEPERPGLTRQVRCVEESLGTIAVEARGRRTGTARLKTSASYVFTDRGAAVAHQWGTAAVTLDGRSCTGAFGLSSYADSGEGGGSLHLRCDDGSVVGAAIRVSATTSPSSPDDGTRPTTTIALTDGYVVER